MKKITLSIILCVLFIGIAKADKLTDGVIVTYADSEVCYKLSDYPTVKYVDSDSLTYAVLYINDVEVLRIALTEKSPVTITYGEYIPSGINEIGSDKIVIGDLDGKKIITGGRLIIVDKEGRQFDTNGKRIK